VKWVVGWGRTFVRSFVGAFIGAFIGAFAAAFVAAFIGAFIGAFVAPLGMDISAGGLLVVASFSGEPTARNESCCCIVFQVQHIPFLCNNMDQRAFAQFLGDNGNGGGMVGRSSAHHGRSWGSWRWGAMLGPQTWRHQ
jgi:hypothetical protein